MRIIVLDGHTLNSGDLSWKALSDLGKCTVYPRTTHDDILPRSREAEIILVNKVALTGQSIRNLDKLAYIGVMATGYNVIDIAAAAEQGVIVTNVPTYGTSSVAQMTFAHILNLTQHVGAHGIGVRQGRWCESDDWCYWDSPLVELDGLTLGIIGFGRIGHAVSRIGHGFGMNVLTYTRPQPIDIPAHVTATDLNTVLSQSDIISLHCPLTPENEHLINEERLKLMKPTAILVNTSRGGLVEEEALAHALNSNVIAGAGLDVLSAEPPSSGNPLLTANNCHITPHIAWATSAARKRLMSVIVENVKAFLSGKPQNVVN